MTSSQLKKLLKEMTREQLDTFILEMYKQQPSDKKEVFALNLQNVKAGKPLESKDAAIPTLKKMQSELDKVYKAASSWLHAGYSWRKRGTRCKKMIKEYWKTLINIPSNCEAFEDYYSYYFKLFGLCALLNEMDDYHELNLWDSLKLTPMAMYLMIIGKIMPGKLTETKMKALMNFSRVPNVKNNFLALDMQEAFVKSMKIGDVRIEYLDSLEAMLKAIEAGSQSMDEKDFDRFRLGSLYLILAREEMSEKDAMESLESLVGKRTVSNLQSLFERKKAFDESKDHHDHH